MIAPGLRVVALAALVAVVLPAALAAAQTSLPAAQTPLPAGDSRFDGQWAVTVTCDDTRDKGALIQGYTLTFPGEVTNGTLIAQHGKIGESSSLRLSGVIKPDGTTEISASGLTGKPEFSMGRIQPSTPYAYRMRGAFTESSGTATRIELRPCRATFIRK